VVTPIGRVGWAGDEFTMEAGEVTDRLRTQLVDIQRGRTPDTYGWVHRVL
jgi:branched-chain amino acid aminotransferase